MGEFDLIALIRERLSDVDGSSRVVLGSGDDAAITAGAGATATSVDMAVDGVHFRRDTASPEQIGGKALAAALSDLAAMAAEPGEVYVQLGLPEDFDESECLRLADGIAAVAGEHGAAVVGGDLVRCPVLVVAVTVVGHAADAETLVRRSGAVVGDVVAVTGALGGAAAGLALLEDPDLETAAGLEPSVAEALRRRQLTPQPRIAAGRLLSGAGVNAMIDVSDGLGSDGGHLAAGTVGLEIDIESLPVQAGVVEVARAQGRDPAQMFVSGGEDYELLATLPEGRFKGASDALAALDLDFKTVGRVVATAGLRLLGPDGADSCYPGFDQLDSRPEDR